MRRFRWRWLFLAAALPLVGAAGGYLWLRQATVAQQGGTLALPGLDAAVVVEREPSGVVHLRAETDRDLFFAQGVVHAQDRLWQMELQRRIGAGRLAEILGPEAVARDRYLRTWGLHRAARAAYGHLDAETRTVIDAYTAGINAYLASDPPLPPEFLLLEIEPDPWTAADVLVWSKLMAYNLADNRRSELLRYRLLARGLEPKRIAALMPLYPGEHPHRQAWVPPAPGGTGAGAAALLALDQDTRQHLPRASNNWVVDGSRSTSGRPLLANDVHLGMQLPSTWHLMHLQSPGVDVIGATLPGLPLVLIGRNAHIAWGVTNLAADVEDLYLIDEAEGGYHYRGGVRPFEMREERIRVRGADDVVIRVRETVHGPVVSDVVENPDGAPALALRWVGHDPDDTTAAAFLGINRARDWQEFRAALRLLVVPGQSFVYADGEGHIGYAASGRLPLRRQGHSGLYPVPCDGGWDWIGLVPADELPRRFDPPEGYLVTANHKITEPGYPYRLSLEWGAEPYRAERIAELIEARALHDLASMRALQQDTVTLLFRDLRPVLAALRPGTPAGRRWRERLLAWDGDAGAGSTESSVFHAWYIALSTLPRAETGTQFWHTHPRYLVEAMTRGDPACERFGGDCLVFAARALDQAVQRLGPEPPPWGELHRAHLAHAVLTHTPLKGLTDRIIPAGGSHFTVNVGWYRPSDWVMYHGPSYRQIIDLADPQRSVFIIAGGQSGNWLTAGYDDQIPLWRAGEHLPMRRKGYTVASSLILEPAP